MRPQLDDRVMMNVENALKRPNVPKKGTMPSDADGYRDEQGKKVKYFSPNLVNATEAKER